MADTILIGEDEPVQRKMLAMMLGKKLGYKTIVAENGRQVVNRVRESNFGDISAVLLDLEMPEMNGLEALAQLRRYRPDLPVLILTARDDTAAAVTAIKEGASDFIVKPADPMQLDVALKNAIRMSTLSRELARLRRDREGALGFHDLIGHDRGLAQAVDYGRKAAMSDVPVFITGEISTGKELLARAVHGESKRTGAPFVAIHCGAIPEPSIESVLFGQEKGMGGAERLPGKFREAERGTIFLDDIHALPAQAQAKLLRVIQQREIEPVGADKPMKVNVRVISATDRDLKALVQSGQFREDLYFRLNVLTIHMPSLKERKDDILPLADYFLRHFSSLDALPLKSLAPGARHYLTDYAWPGNVRELEGLMHRALVLSEKDAIDRDLLLSIHEAESPAEGGTFQGMHIALKKPNGLPKTMAEIETEAMQKTLEQYGSNITRAAEALGIAKSTFYRKIKG
ncbi:MAG: sigma-54-dependent Fis family transcriptional regulator [Pseudomonadota bacterium]|nr:sigma-54-dependent Fis family transcriptional regulator [Pseudomonadota bacterium]